MVLSIIIGLVLEAANLALLSFLVKRIIKGRGRAWMTFLWVTKFGVLALLVWAALAYLKLHPIGFILGLTLPLIVAIYRSLFSQGKIKDGGI